MYLDLNAQKGATFLVSTTDKLLEMYSFAMLLFNRLRPHYVEYTGSPPITAVKFAKQIKVLNCFSWLLANLPSKPWII